MTKYSQRDARWSNTLMGDGTIGRYGCLITCLSMISDTDPDIMNNLIKSVQGYTGNFLIWDKLDSIRGFDFIKRVKVYENLEVVNNLPCIVEVDGSPIGGDRHWVLYIGNQRLLDPWDGTEKSTSSYTPLGYAVVKYVKPATQPVFNDQTKISKDLLNWSEDLEIQQIRSLLSELRRLGEENNGLKLDLIAKDKMIADLQEKLNTTNPLIQQIHDVLYGPGWWWVKWAKIKELLPK